MANEIEVAEFTVVKDDGEWQIYPGKPVTVQQLDQNAAQQDSAALNDQTKMVRIENKHTAGIRVTVRDSGSFTISDSNSVYLASNGVIDMHVNKAQGQIVSVIND